MLSCAPALKNIQYVLKYVNKGSDMAVFGLQQSTNRSDESEHFQTAHHVSTSEACWRIFDFPIHECHPTVQTYALRTWIMSKGSISQKTVYRTGSNSFPKQHLQVSFSSARMILMHSSYFIPTNCISLGTEV